MSIPNPKYIDGVLSEGSAPFKKCAVIVAGGTGSRAGGDVPKQFRLLKGRPMAWWAINTFRLEDPATRIILVLHKAYLAFWKDLMASLPIHEQIECEIVAGGNNRRESVENALKLINRDSFTLIAVHDAARPLLSIEMLRRGWKKAMETGACVPVVPLTDSIRHLVEDTSESVARKDYVAVQTPQIFISDVIKKAYELPDSEDFTDDASIVEATGAEIALFEGEHRNFKITNPCDFAIAELFLDELENA